MKGIETSGKWNGKVQRSNMFLITENEQVEVRLFFDSDVAEESPCNGWKVQGDIQYCFSHQIFVGSLFILKIIMSRFCAIVTRQSEEQDVKKKKSGNGEFPR